MDREEKRLRKIERQLKTKRSAGSTTIFASGGSSGGGTTVVPASETASGIAELATQTETDAGTDDERIVTPLKNKQAVLYSNQVFDTDRKFYEQCEWIAGLNFFTSATTGAGTFVLVTNGFGVDNTEHAIGVLEFYTGTTAVGSARISKGTVIAATGFNINLKWRQALSNLSTVGETYTITCGFTGGANDGIFFRYTNAVNSGRWEAVTRSGGSETASDTGVSAVTTFDLFQIDINSTGTSVGFYINGTLVVTTTTNIPSVEISTFFDITKSVGTTGRSMYQDWYQLLLLRTVAR